MVTNSIIAHQKGSRFHSPPLISSPLVIIDESMDVIYWIQLKVTRIIGQLKICFFSEKLCSLGETVFGLGHK